MSSTVAAIPSINGDSDNRSKKVNQGPGTSKRSTIDRTVVSYSKQIIALAADVTQVVDRVVKAVTSRVPVFKVCGLSTPATRIYNLIAAQDHYSYEGPYSEYIENVAKDVNKVLEKIISVSQAVDMARSEIWKVVFTESENEEMADVEVKPWDELKAKVWEVVQGWMNAVDVVAAAVRAWKALRDKRDGDTASLVQQAWDVASVEESKAWQAVQAENWDEMTTQAWDAARLKLYQTSKDWNTFTAECMILQLEATKATDTAITATVKAAQVWKQANDKISAVSNAKRHPGTQKEQGILSIFK
jgi:hypothetical protein